MHKHLYVYIYIYIDLKCWNFFYLFVYGFTDAPLKVLSFGLQLFDSDSCSTVLESPMASTSELAYGLLAYRLLM